MKGDIEEIKEEIELADIQQFGREANVFAGLLLSTMLLPVPLVLFLAYVGCGIWGIIAILCVYYAGKVEKLKKRFDVQTYKEILVFVEGKQLDKTKKIKNKGNDRIKKHCW